MTVSKSAARSTPSARATAERLPSPYRLLFLVSLDCPNWFRQLHDTLAQSAIQTYVCTDTEAYEPAIRQFQPDAIVGHPDAACAALYTSLVLVEPLHRPLCVLVENEDSADEAVPADLISPPSARTLRRQLDTVIQLRTELRAAHERGVKLQRDAEKQRRKATDTQRRLERDIVLLSEANAAELERVLANLSEIQARWDNEQQRLRDLERKIAESDVLKQAIFSNVSHEFRTPLLQIKGAVKFLSDSDPDNSVINMAVQSVAKLEASVQNMTQLASSLDIELAPVVIREIIQAAARKVENSLIHKDIADRVRLHIADRLPPVLGNSKGLVAVVQRLIDNALKFGKGKPVDVSAQRDGDMVMVSVQDYGIGIATADIPRIFDIFYQVDGSSTRQFGGMGIGLAIVRTILDKHDVEIRVVSVLGKGTTISFCLRPVSLRPDASIW